MAPPSVEMKGRKTELDSFDAGMTPSPTQAGYAASWINRAILSGSLAPGDRLKQDEIAERIGMSLIPVREALRRLVGDGQLVYSPRRGYFVAQLSRANMLEIYDTRGVLEDHLLEGIVHRYDDADILEMRTQLDHCTVALAEGDLPGTLQAHWDFFAAMLLTRDRPYAAKLLRQLWQVTNAYAPFYYGGDQGRGIGERVRRNVLAAVEARDQTALEDAVRSHREQSLAVLIPFTTA